MCKNHLSEIAYIQYYSIYNNYKQIILNKYKIYHITCKNRYYVKT